MATQNPTVFEPRHLDSLPRPLIQSLIGVVLFLHGMLIILALQSIPLVELGGNGGGGSGNSALYVSVLQGIPASRVTPKQESTLSAERTIAIKEKPQSGLITTSSTTTRTAQTARNVENRTIKPSETNTQKQQTPADTRSSATSATESGSGNPAFSGTGTGVGNGKSTGAGQGEGKGNSVGTGGSGNGPARSVSLSQLKYKRAVKPEYPARSIQRHETGQVNIQDIVDAAGRVHDARLSTSSGFDRLDEAALRAARRSTFHPYMEHGRPIYAMAIIPYRFNLNK